MQMDFNLSPPGMAMFCQAIDQAFLILLRGIKISVHERPTVTISVGLHQPRILPAPKLYSPFLQLMRSASQSVFRDNAWFKVIRQCEN
jgi:hypothetical protein